jgi:hypothetical protein
MIGLAERAQQQLAEAMSSGTVLCPVVPRLDVRAGFAKNATFVPDFNDGSGSEHHNKKIS